MSELLLQTIVEKLNALSIVLLKQDNTGDAATQQALIKEIKSFQSETKLIRENLKLNNDKISELTDSFNNYTFQTGKSGKNNIEHRHVFHKGIWVAVVLFNISILLAIAWNNALQTQKQYEANDMKYRSLKVTGNKSLIELLYHTDSLYNVKTEAIRKMTVQEEQRLAEQAEMLLLAGEKEKEAKQLKRKATKGKQ